jgi:hypothetical protein
MYVTNKNNLWLIVCNLWPDVIGDDPTKSLDSVLQEIRNELQVIRDGVVIPYAYVSIHSEEEIATHICSKLVKMALSKEDDEQPAAGMKFPIFSSVTENFNHFLEIKNRDILCNLGINTLLYYDFSYFLWDTFAYTLRGGKMSLLTHPELQPCPIGLNLQDIRKALNMWPPKEVVLDTHTVKVLPTFINGKEQHLSVTQDNVDGVLSYKISLGKYRQHDIWVNEKNESSKSKALFHLAHHVYTSSKSTYATTANQELHGRLVIPDIEEKAKKYVSEHSTPDNFDFMTKAAEVLGDFITSLLND